MRALLGVFLFFFIAFIVLLLMLIRFMFNLSSRNKINRQRRHRQYYQQGSTTQKDGVEVIDTRDPQTRDKKVIPDNEGEYVEPIEDEEKE